MIVKGIVALALAASTATPLPKPTTAPLRVIVTVKASSPCAQMATHANAAILLTLRNDSTLQQTIAQLRDVHLNGSNRLRRDHSMNKLFTLSGRLLRSAHDADRETQKILEYAKSVKDPKQKARLLAFVHAIGGAVGRQRKIARDLDGFVTTLEAYQSMRMTSDEIAAVDEPEQSGASPVGPSNRSLMDESARSVETGTHTMYWNGTRSPSQRTGMTNDQLAARAASNFSDALPAIATDEATASAPIEQAAEHC